MIRIHRDIKHMLSITTDIMIYVNNYSYYNRVSLEGNLLHWNALACNGLLRIGALWEPMGHVM